MRRKAPRKLDRKIFVHSAEKTRSINLVRVTPRGGIRL